MVLLSFVIPFTVLALLSLLSERVTRGMAARLQAITSVLTMAFVLVYVVNAFHYVFQAGFYDHVEPSVVTIVRLLDAGQPVYHDLSSASRYSLQYGPNCFIAPWLAIKALGDSIPSFKVLSAFFAIGTLGLVYSALRSSVTTSFARQAGLIYLCGTSLLFWNTMVWIRSDSQMLFWTALGLWAALRKHSFFSFAVMGAAAAACFNTKIHGIFYFAPIIALAMRQSRWLHWGVQSDMEPVKVTP